MKGIGPGKEQGISSRRHSATEYLMTTRFANAAIVSRPKKIRLGVIGLGTVGYLLLVAYLGWLLCGNGLAGWFLASRRIKTGGALRASGR